MKSTKKIPFSYLKNPLHLIATGFGSGLMPKAPGTFGTLVAIPLYLLINNFDFWFYILITLAITILGVFVCDYTSKALKVHDHSGIVIDEIAGYFITMIAVPFDWVWVVAGFLLFRFFDILKPWPISWLDKNVHGGLGIMLDDVLAGVFSLICLHFIIYII